MAEQTHKDRKSITDNIVMMLKSIYKFFTKPLVKYIFRRIFNSFITMFFIVTVVFLLLRMIPKERYINYGVLNKLPLSAKETYKQSLWKKYGIDKPVHEQLLNYYKNLIPIPKKVCVQDQFDEDFNEICVKYETVYITFGNSITYKYGKPISELIGERFPVSFKLSIWSLLISYLIAYPLGVYMAKNKGGLIDKLGNAYIVATIAVPALIYYYLWMIISMKFLKLPSVFDPDNFLSWITPIWALAFVTMGGIAMWVRRFMVDEKSSDYVSFARSKGLSEKRIMFTHVLRNAIVPLIRNIPAALLFTIVGSYFIEMLWVIPGSGNLLINALTKNDSPLVQALAIVYAALSMAALLLGDLITVFFDPRISLTKNK